MGLSAFGCGQRVIDTCFNVKENLVYSKMKVAVYHNLPAGGGKRSAYEWLKLLTKYHEVDLFFYNSQAEIFLDSRPFVRKVYNATDVVRNKNNHFGRLFFLFRVWKKSKEIALEINSGGYDVAFVMQDDAFNSPFVLRYLKIKSLYFCQEPLAKAKEFHYNLNRGPIERLLRNLLIAILSRIDRSNASKATMICSNSLYSTENIYRWYGIYPRLNYLGVDTSLFRPMHLVREPVILYVGSILPSKGCDFIIKSVATLEVRPTVRFICHVSDSKYQEELVELAKELNVSISFDYLPHQLELVHAYNTVYLTVFATLLEPLGLVPLESMACGTPVVGIAEAGIRETIKHDINGLLTERDHYEFGQAINKLMTDKNLWTKFSIKGLEDVRSNWSWDKSYHKLESYLENLRIS
jgi:glycosyltransferase involved in cell wall biosynthesis